jgi:RimJ/RimL family protein N-acetyltransferase
MLTIRPLSHADTSTLSAMLRAQRPEYLQYFRPFAFDEATLSNMLASRVRDLYFGVFWQNELSAFFMLRGWDEGYEVPAFGVIVAEPFRGKGFGTLTLELANVICRLRGSSELMLKVHPNNRVAWDLYVRAGFRETGFDARTGDIVLRRALAPVPHSPGDR